uniref:Conotoxin n=1 Tax=Conus praecellens TaxID=128530 RepID=A0A291C280_CONPC|nr:conotoxin [Conus praecellens]
MTMNMSMTLIAFAMVVMASSVIGSIPRQCKGKDFPCRSNRYHRCCRYAMRDCLKTCLRDDTHNKCWSPCYKTAAEKFGCRPGNGCCPTFLDRISGCLMEDRPLKVCWRRTKSVAC